jgi:hypothetical protein
MDAGKIILEAEDCFTSLRSVYALTKSARNDTRLYVIASNSTALRAFPSGGNWEDAGKIIASSDS